MVNQPFLNQTRTIPIPGKLPGYVLECYQITVATGNQAGVWQAVNPQAHALPAFITQLIIITSLTRFLYFLLKPFRQSRIVAEIIAGILLGPSFMGKVKRQSSFLDAVFSVSGVMTSETTGNIGLIYFLFLLGLEIDLTTVSQVGKKALSVALLGTVFPFAMGVALYYLLVPDPGKVFQIGCIFWGVALIDSGLSVTTQILAELKLLNTEIGKTSMSSAIVNEIILWGLFTFLMAMGNDVGKSPWALVSTIGFLLLCYYVIRPDIAWTICRTQKNGHLNEETICIILTSVLACGLVTDILGTSSIIGAFAFGLVIPNGLLGPKFVEVLKGFVEELLLPFFFATSGFRTNFDSLVNSSSWVLVAFVVVLA